MSNDIKAGDIVFHIRSGELIGKVERCHYTGFVLVGNRWRHEDVLTRHKPQKPVSNRTKDPQ